MTEFILDAEWKVEQNDHPILDAQHLHCIVLKRLTDNTIITFANDLTLADHKTSDFKLWIESQLLRHKCTFIAHNILAADLMVFARLLDMPYNVLPDSWLGHSCKFIDTLSWSRRLWPDRPAVKGTKSIHGLAAWGVRTGIAKPEVHDWSEQPLPVYIHRCKEDVEINHATYLKLLEEKNR